MHFIELDPDLNRNGADAVAGFYNAITDQLPSLGLTPDNSKIVYVKGFYDLQFPNRTICIIRKNNQLLTDYKFTYDRFNIKTLLEDYAFSEEQILSITDEDNSGILLDFLAEDLDVNFKPEGFWVSRNYLELTGGEVGPNFMLEATYDNLWFTGKLIMPLVGEAEPVGEAIYKVTFNVDNWEPDSGFYLKEILHSGTYEDEQPLNLSEFILLEGKAVFDVATQSIQILEKSGRVTLGFSRPIWEYNYNGVKFKFSEMPNWDVRIDYIDKNWPIDGSTDYFEQDEDGGSVTASIWFT